MKKNKPIILVDPFPRTMDILFSKENLKYLNNNFKLLNAPKKNKINFYKKKLPNAKYIFGQPSCPGQSLTYAALKNLTASHASVINS